MGPANIPEQPTSIAESLISSSSSSIESEERGGCFDGEDEVTSSISGDSDSDLDSPEPSPVTSASGYRSQPSVATSNSEDISFLSLTDIHPPQSSQSSEDGDNQLPSPLLHQSLSVEPEETDVVPLPLPGPTSVRRD